MIGHLVRLFWNLVTLFEKLLLRLENLIWPETPIKNAPSESEKRNFQKSYLPEFDGPKAGGDIFSFSVDQLPTTNSVIPDKPQLCIERILQCHPRDLYRIVGVARNATADVIKKGYRFQSLRVHPDKTQLGGADKAFKQLSLAYEVLSVPEARTHYEVEVTFASGSVQSHLSKVEATKKYVSRVEELMRNSLGCSACNGVHMRNPTDRLIRSARWCDECQRYHAAKLGDIWIEKRKVGWLRTQTKAYVYLDGQISEATEWAVCQGLQTMLPCNAHTVAMKVGAKDRDKHNPPPASKKTKKKR